MTIKRAKETEEAEQCIIKMSPTGADFEVKEMDRSQELERASQNKKNRRK